MGYLSTFRDDLSGALNMGPIGCPETSVNSYQSTLRDIPEERRSQECVKYVLYAFYI
jgi:hypothetical protein